MPETTETTETTEHQSSLTGMTAKEFALLLTTATSDQLAELDSMFARMLDALDKSEQK